MDLDGKIVKMQIVSAEDLSWTAVVINTWYSGIHQDMKVFSH